MTSNDRYEQAKQDVLFTAWLTAKDPATYLDALQHAVEAMREAWDAHVDATRVRKEVN